MDFFPGQGNYAFYILHSSFCETQDKIFKIHVENEILYSVVDIPLPFAFAKKKKKNNPQKTKQKSPSLYLIAFLRCVCLSFSYIFQEKEKIIMSEKDSKNFALSDYLYDFCLFL